MNPVNTLRPQALTLAAQIVKKTQMSFGAAQKQAWATVKLVAQMHTRPVGFHYVKGDGMTRFAIGSCTAQSTTTNPGKATSPLVVSYFDTRAGGVRSFRADRLIIP